MAGIWNSIESFVNIPKVDEKFKLTIDEGVYKLEELNLKANKYLILREDINPSGSFKDRGLAYQLSYYYSKGISNFAISTSGNAGNSLIKFARKYPFLEVNIFYSDNLAENKIEKLSQILGVELSIVKLGLHNGFFKHQNISIYSSNSAKIDCIRLCNNNSIHNLRASNDDIAINGYMTIANDIGLLEFEELFLLASSGTAFIGINQGMDLKFPNKIYTSHLIQTPKIHPLLSRINDQFSEIDLNSDSSMINCIVDRVGNRKNSIYELSKHKTIKGDIVANNDIINIRKVLESEEFENYSKLSANTLAPLSVAYRLNEQYNNKGKTQIIIFSGI
jgi:hypothetical protein